MPALDQDVIRLLSDLGLSLEAHQVNIDMERAVSCYVHHTQMPVAVTGYALASPDFAKRAFPKTTFIDVIQKRPSMDEPEEIALAAVCGVEMQPPFGSSSPELFGQLLWESIARYDLDPFFEQVDRPYGSTGDHFLMRPRGFDWSHPHEPELPGGLAAWRAAYRKLPKVRQLWVATILQLYLQRPDPYWMVRVPKHWHAVDAICTLRDSGSLKDWARLYALYPGW